MTTAAALAVEHLHVRMGSTPILRDVSLSVAGGGVAALIGRNGAGKTTTLRTLMGLVSGCSGVLRLGHRDLMGVPAHQRARLGMGYVPEDRALISRLGVEDNLLLASRACRRDRHAEVGRLDRVYSLMPELARLRTRQAGTLSGGQQKMVALGRALMIGHRLLLLDEPFQGLAPTLARRYAATLADLRRQDADLAIVVAESNPALLASLAVTQRYRIERGEVTVQADQA